MTKLPTGRHTQTIKSAKKNRQFYAKNKALRTTAKTSIRKINEAVTSGDQSQLQQLVPEATSIIDKVAAKGAMHKKKASRLKSRLAKKINKLKTSK